MRNICPYCQEVSDNVVVKKEEKYNIRGDSITVNSEFFKCKNCHKEFEIPSINPDPLESAYLEYRKKHQMLLPEEIYNLRKKYGLTQNELSKLLGWGLATLSRYENGALQDDAHDKLLKLMADPDNLLELIRQSPDAIDEKRKSELAKQLLDMKKESFSLSKMLEDIFGSYEPDEYSGYKRLDFEKFKNAVLFFCEGAGVFKTVLNKLLFYADFKYFKSYTVSITGTRYAHIPYGPAPDKYQYYFAELQEDCLELKEQGMGEKFLSKIKPDLRCFKEEELKILLNIKDYFKNYSAKKISDFSHNEKAYMETLPSKLISYEYALQLKV